MACEKEFDALNSALATLGDLILQRDAIEAQIAAATAAAQAAQTAYDNCVNPPPPPPPPMPKAKAKKRGKR